MATALGQKLRTCHADEVATNVATDPATFAGWLGLDVAIVERYPVATYEEICMRVMDRFGSKFPIDVKIDDWPKIVYRECLRLHMVVNDWVASFDNRTYRVGGCGTERDFEDWLVDNVHRLGDLDYPLRLVERQPRLCSGRLIPDLLCRLSQDTEWAQKDDWLVVENKVSPGSVEAGDQVVRYINAVREERAAGTEQVFGLLIAEGASATVESYLEEVGVGFVSVASLMYRRRNWPALDEGARARLA